MAEDDHFFSRWSRRKVQARQGLVPETRPASEPRAGPAPTPAVHAAPVSTPAAPDNAQAPVSPPVLTLEDVGQLTRDSDFSRFVAPEVSGEVRNAALKKLFTDPHFNVMDGLDIYIDDYSRPDPLPAQMLRQMAQSAYVGLADPQRPETAGALPAAPATQLTAQPPLGTDAGHSEDTQAMTRAADADAAALKAPDEDPDLRLQPHHDPGSSGTGPGAGEGPPGQR